VYTGPTQPTLSAACTAVFGSNSKPIAMAAQMVVVKILFVILSSFLVAWSHLKRRF
jgi:hypothetical protein